MFHGQMSFPRAFVALILGISPQHPTFIVCVFLVNILFMLLFIDFCFILIFLFIYLFFYSFIYLFIFLFIHLFIYLFILNWGNLKHVLN